ncbi:glycosyltransferase family 2 protein [Anaerostipes faecalis]|uniref:glycosyltransferase family 2 protein n=1 Tax=Anaerostipes faecalis TaxID=2738446 RepID=UPI003EFD26DD
MLEKKINDQNPVLSIVMPVYNAERYLNLSIQSVLSQTYKNFELILVDDGSTDESLVLCKKYQILDSRIRVISQENKGISGARNTGIEHAIGKYITFIDSDDIIQSKMYEIMMKQMQSDDLELIMCGAVRKENYRLEEIEENYEICELTKENLYDRIFSNSEIDWKYMGVWNKIYKTEIVKNIKFMSAGTEDTVFNCQYFSYVKHAS